MTTLDKLLIAVLGSTSLGILIASNYSFPLLDLFPLLRLISLLLLLNLLGLRGRSYTLSSLSKFVSSSSSSLVEDSIISSSLRLALVGRVILSN